MDQTGEYLVLAGAAAERLFGERATVFVEKMPRTYPETNRWRAGVKTNREPTLARYGHAPDVAVRHLATELLSATREKSAADLALQRSASRVGLG